MNVFVVTPYFHPNMEWLRQAHASVHAQTVPCHHVLVCDGGPVAEVPGFVGSHLVGRRNYRDFGDTPRFIGTYFAVASDADAVAFLDADNWFYPNHIEGALACAEANGLDAVCTARMLHRIDGSPMVKCPWVTANPLVDTNCLIIRKGAFRQMVTWVLGEQNQALGWDQVVWRGMIESGLNLGFLDQATVAYRTNHAIHYQYAGETPPPGATITVSVPRDQLAGT